MPNQLFPSNSVSACYQLYESRSRFGLSWLSLLTFGALVIAAPSVSAAALTDWQYDPKANQLLVTVKEGTTPKYFLMAQPARIVLDLPDTEMGEVKLKESYSGAVRQVRVSQFQPGLTRIVLELSPDVALAPDQVKLESIRTKDSNGKERWVLRPLIAGMPAIAPKPIAPKPSGTPIQSAKPSETPKTATVETPAKATTTVSNADSGASAQPGKATLTESKSTTKPKNDASTPTIVLPPSAIGSDVGTTAATISVPPLTPSQPAAETPPQQVAQLLPEPTTPLPPATAQPGFAIDTSNATTISVPPPVAPPTAPSEIVIQRSGATVVQPAQIPKAAPASSVLVQPVTVPAAVIKPVVPVAVPGRTIVTDIPSTVQLAPTVPAISVPPLSPLGTLPAAPLQPAQTPAPMQVPPLNRMPPQTPLSGVMQSSGVMPIQPVMQPPAVQPAIRPPVSSVMQSSITPSPARTPIVMPPLPTATAPTLTVPPLQPLTPASPPSPTIEFGQPLPTNGAVALNTVPRGISPSPIQPWQQQTFQSPNPSVVLPVGTVLSLSYPGATEMRLEAGQPRQEVLLLQTEVRDAAGNLVLPRGSYVTGQFESDRVGSRFVASSIRVGDRTIPFAAESDVLGGDRSLSATSLAMYSGAGALAGGLVSRFSGLGLLLGGAAGAATNYFTAPKPAMLQPAQIIQVRVLRDLQ